MATYLLDTNIIIDVLNGKKSRSGLLLDLTVEQGHTLGCCPIDIAAVYTSKRPQEEHRAATLLRSRQLFSITFPIGKLAGSLKRDHARKGVTLSLADAMIAAVAIHNRLTLITGNVKDFPMKSLSLFSLTT